MGSIISKQPKIHATPEKPHRTVQFSNILVKPHQSTLSGSIFAAYTPAPLLHLRTSPAVLSAPALEITSSLSFPISAANISLLLLKVTFKPFEGHKKDVSGYVASLNAYIAKISNIVTSWSGYLWKIEDSDRIYCVFGDFAQSEAHRIPGSPHNLESTASRTAQDGIVPESAVRATRLATLCANELASKLNNYADRALGVKFNLHLVITAGSAANIIHLGGIQDKWCPLLLLEAQHNSTLHHLMKISRSGEVLLSNQAHALIENDLVRMTQQEYERSEHKSRIEEAQQEQSRHEKVANDEVKSILHGWIDKRKSIDSKVEEVSPQKIEYREVPPLRVTTPSVYDTEADDLGSVFDSDEEREYLALSARRRAKSDYSPKEQTTPSSRFPRATGSHVEVKRFQCKSKHDAWQLEYSFSGDEQIKSDVMQYGFLPFLSQHTSFTDRDTYVGYLSNHQVARIDAQYSRVPQHLALSLMTVKFPHLGAVSDMDVEQMQRTIVAIQKLLLTYNGSIQDLRVDPFSNLILIAVFGLELRGEGTHAYRAVACAKDIATVLEQDFDADTLPTVGIATGYVFACEIGSSMRKAYVLLGDTSNLCVDLANAASSTHFGILVDMHTYVATKQRVSYYNSLRPLFRNKKEEFVYSPAFVGENMISRSEELQEITSTLDSWYCDESDFNSIVIRGELGVGKSIMVQEILRSAAKNNHMYLLAEGSTATKDIVLYPFRALYRRLFGEPKSEVTPYYSHVATLFRSLSSKYNESHLHLLNMILPVNFPAQAPMRVDKQYLLRFFADLFRALMGEQREVCILHKLQHFDSLSLELVAHLHTHLSSKLLMIATTDAEAHNVHVFQNNDVSRTKIIDILSDFDEPHIKQLICRLMRSRDCESAVVAFVHEISSGHPLYIKELTLLLSARHFIECDSDLCARFSSMETPVDELRERIPSKLYSIVRERVLLQKELRHEILQYAALSQRPLTLDLMSGLVAPEYRDQLPTILRELEESQFLETVGSSNRLEHDEPHFVIENDLLRQVVTDLLSDKHIKQRHEALARQFIRIVRESRELEHECMPHVCHHTQCAVAEGARPVKLIARSLHYQEWLGAEYLALGLSKQALMEFDRASELIKAVQNIDTSADVSQEEIHHLDLRLSYGLLVSLFANGGFDFDKMSDLSSKVCSMCDDSTDQLDHVIVANAIVGLNHLLQKNTSAAEQILDECLQKCKSANSHELMSFSYNLQALCQLLSGKFAQCIGTIDHCTELESRGAEDAQLIVLGISSSYLLPPIRALCLACQGDLSSAAAIVDDIIAKWSSGDHSHGERVALLLTVLCTLSAQYRVDRVPVLLEHVGKLDYGRLNWNSLAECVAGCIVYKKSDVEERAGFFIDAKALLQSELFLFQPVALVLWVDALLANNDLDEAERLLLLAQQMNPQHMWSSRIHHLQAEVASKRLLTPTETDSVISTSDLVSAARTRFSKAATCAQKQQAFTLELQTLVHWFQFESRHNNGPVTKAQPPKDLKSLSDQRHTIMDQLRGLTAKQINQVQTCRSSSSQEAQIASSVLELELLMERRNVAMQKVQQSVEEKRSHPALANFRRDTVAVKELSAESIRELCSLKRPSRSIKLLSQACCILKEISKPTLESSPSKSAEPARKTLLDAYWSAARAAMQEDNFFNIVDLDISTLTSLKIDKVKALLSEQSEFHEEDVVRLSVAAEQLLTWLRTVIEVYDIQSTLLSEIQQLEKKRSKTKDLEISLQQLKEAHNVLAKKKHSNEERLHYQQMQVQEIQQQLIELEYKLDAAEPQPAVSMDTLRQSIKQCLKHIQVSDEANLDFVESAQRIAQGASE